MTKKEKEVSSDVEKGCSCLLVIIIVLGSIALIIWKFCELIFRTIPKL